ncbi:AAA family ATPase [Caulobacter sp. KR2-114]|uniref:AAA family ATPase n=1 Tax=Caulobacter sp. KR2-114 TaxID=3400912 RepID=UPI003C0B9368
MIEAPKKLRFLAAVTGGQDESNLDRVAVVDAAVGGPDRMASLAALFPHVQFDSVGETWPDRTDPRVKVLIAPVRALSATEVDAACARLKTGPRTVIVLSDADVMTTRRLLREGAADVLTTPVSEPSMAVCLERLLAETRVDTGGGGRVGEVVTFLKAGGGVGATALATQLAAVLASRVTGRLALADLDVQFGAAAMYLDMPEAISLSDFLGPHAAALDETPFATVLSQHRSKAQVLAAPRELTPLEGVTPAQVDTLIGALRRDFALTLVDLPSVWTAWTNRVLNLSDRIVLVTQLSVPHVNLVKRQLRVLAAQGLDQVPLVLVCNALSSDQQASLPLKAAEKALGRNFDVVLPEDRRLMNAAINQGVELSAIKRGAKLEKAIAELSERVGAGVLSPVSDRRLRW